LDSDVAVEAFLEDTFFVLDCESLSLELSVVIVLLCAC
jgi:hypothetical protein